MQGVGLTAVEKQPLFGQSVTVAAEDNKRQLEPLLGG